MNAFFRRQVIDIFQHLLKDIVNQSVYIKNIQITSLLFLCYLHFFSFYPKILFWLVSDVLVNKLNIEHIPIFIAPSAIRFQGNRV